MEPVHVPSIPAASFSYWLSRPDNAFDEEWVSPTEHRVVSDDPELLRRLDALDRPPTQYLDAAGAPIRLTPGRTWVELPEPGTTGILP